MSAADDSVYDEDTVVGKSSWNEAVSVSIGIVVIKDTCAWNFAYYYAFIMILTPGGKIVNCS